MWAWCESVLMFDTTRLARRSRLRITSTISRGPSLPPSSASTLDPGRCADTYTSLAVAATVVVVADWWALPCSAGVVTAVPV